MNKLKELYLIIALLFSSILVSACKFPDNIPDWQNIKDYKPDIIKFGETTADDFADLVQSKPDQKIGDVVIFSTCPPETSIYKKIRVGFKNNKLDWIEFTLSDNFEISKFTNILGEPPHINNTYSDSLDYYDYNFFNISTDKQHTFAKNITIFEKPEKIIDLGKFIPDWKNLNNSNFLGLKPGYSLEADFNTAFPELISAKSTNKGNASVYILDKQLGKAKLQYKRIELVYRNSLLSWISFIPQDLQLNQLVKAWGSQYTVESVNTKYDMYDFSNVIAVVNKVSKKVVKIGVISAK